jgi:hypothetical protein
VHELREHPAELVDAHVADLAELERPRRVEHRIEHLRREEVGKLLGIDVDRPVDVRRSVPLELLRLLVEGEQRRLLDPVIPVEERVGGRRDRFQGAGGGQGNLGDRGRGHRASSEPDGK